MNHKITICDIAQKANVSKTTVSFYLNGHFEKMSEATKEHIGQVIASLGYQPKTAARSLRKKPSCLLGLLVKDITCPFFPSFLQGLTLCTEERGYQLILSITEGDPGREEQCLINLARLDADGFFVQPSSHFSALWKTTGLEKPLVSLDFPLSPHIPAARDQGRQTAELLINCIEGKQILSFPNQSLSYNEKK